MFWIGFLAGAATIISAEFVFLVGCAVYMVKAKEKRGKKHDGE